MSKITLDSVLTTLKSWSGQVQNVIQSGGDATPYVQALIKTFTGTVTAEELKALAAKSDALSDELQKPLEPEA